MLFALATSRATCRLAAVFAAAATLSAASTLRAVAIAHWSFDTTQGDKNIYPDSVGGVHPATPKQAAQVKPFAGDAPFGHAVQFSTENGQKESYLTTTPINNMQSTNLTVCAWVYLTKMHANFVITDWKATSEAAWVFGVDLPKAGATIATPIVDLRSGDIDPARRGNHFPVARYSDPKKNVPLNEWHHLAWTWTRTPGTLITYLDGEVIGTANQMHVPMDLTPAKNTVRIGGREANNYNMDGAIDELWMYNEALNATQIKNLMLYNNTGGTGPLAKVLVRKPDGTFALATPAPPVAEPPPAPPRPSTPVAAGNQRPPRTPPLARNNNPTPAPTPAPTPTPTADLGPKPPPSEPAVVAPPEPPPQTTADEDLAPPSPTAALSTVGADTIAPSSPVLASASRRYTPGRVAGMISCGVLSVVLSAYLLWAMNERAKIRSRM